MNELLNFRAQRGPEIPRTVSVELFKHFGLGWSHYALVELTLPPEANIFASKYQLYLPSKEELKSQLEKIEADFEEGRDE